VFWTEVGRSKVGIPRSLIQEQNKARHAGIPVHNDKFDVRGLGVGLVRPSAFLVRIDPWGRLLGQGQTESHMCVHMAVAPGDGPTGAGPLSVRVCNFDHYPSTS